ncbi:MAG: GNAT family N-acetyltransferase [Promethearchaeota archaeon]
MDIIKIGRDNEDIFYDHVRGQEFEFFFFVMDYKQYPQNTQLFAAIDASKTIQGMFIIWRKETIQLRGTVAAARVFIEYLVKENVEIKEITGTTDHATLLDDYYPTFAQKFNLYRMTLQKGEERLQPTQDYQILTSSYAEQIAVFLGRVDPVFFGNRQASDIEFDENHPTLAIMQGNRILSIACLWIDKEMGIINVIGTDPDFRNQGLATAMVSSGISYLFQHTSKILIHVRVENLAAVKIYQKAGYTPQFEYVVYKIKL